MSYTPGPWGYDHTFSTGEGLDYYEIAPFNESGELLLWEQEIAATADANEDNARLISAAPELYEALLAVSKALNNCRGYYEREDVTTWRFADADAAENLAIVALTKAVGAPS